MRNLPNTKLSIEEYHKVLKRRKISGGEADIYYSENLHTAYKIFSNSKLEGHMSENKAKKLALLYQKPLDHCTRPVSTLSVNGILVGYELTYDNDDKTFLPIYLSRSDLIHYLEESKNILEFFASQGIIYGDVATRNILINRSTGNLKFCDMDNISINNYPIDMFSRELENYRQVWGINQQADIYMHNIMCLNSFDIDLYNYCKGHFSFFFEEAAEDIVSNMQNVKKFNGKSIVSYIKRR